MSELRAQRSIASDPISLEILWNQLIATVDEMAAALARSAFSVLVREGNDLSAVILDANGRGIAQSTRTIPSFANIIPLTVRHMLESFPREPLEPGDVLITNDPWLAAGHLPDLVMVKPVFRGRRLVAFVSTVAHLPDIGGAQLSSGAHDVHEEGLLIPVARLFVGGVLNRDIDALIRANVRVPDLVVGDIEAQLGVCQLGQRRLLQLMDDWELGELDDVAAAICERGEAACRAAIGRVANGEYRYSVEGDGAGERIELVARVTVTDDAIDVNYTGSSPQSRRGINSVANYTFAYTTYTLKCVLVPEIPNNHGLMNPFTVSAPEGSILNPRRPAPVGGRALTGHLLPDTLMGALAHAVPTDVIAQSGAPPWLVILRGTGPGGEFTESYALGTGMGARATQDGIACTTFPSNGSNAPIEMLERQCPIRFRMKELRSDSAGAGRWRGGLGQKVVFEVLGDAPLRVTCLAGKLETGARGICGGLDAAPGAILVNGSAVADPGGVLEVSPGDTVTLVLPGGGGYGVAGERDPELVARDRANGYVKAP